MQIIQGGEPVGEARLVDSYANTKVRRGDINRQIEIADTQSAEEPATPRRPVDNSLSASRLHWDDDNRDDDDERSTDAMLPGVNR